MNENKALSFKNTFRAVLDHTWAFSRMLLAGLALLYLLSGIYSVSQNEVGVHLRWGRVINEKVQPGIHYRLPWPFDAVEKVAVRQVKRMAVDEFWGLAAAGEESFKALTGLDSYCITGDNNLAMVSCVIQYTVLNPHDYLFRVRDPERMLRNLACKSILHCMARMPIDDILTRGKQAVATYIRGDLQEKLDLLNTGINVSFIEINNISPPDRVAKYFSEVVKASIDREKNINEAESYRNEVIPKAKARAMESLEEAEGYKQEAILTAEGKTQRFEKLLVRAGKEGDTARELLYTESMREIMKGAGTKKIVDKAGDGHPAVNLRIRAAR